MADPLFVFGFGNMGRAIVRGAIQAGVVRSEQVLAFEPAEPAQDAARRMGIRVTGDPALAAREITSAALARILLAIKPQSLPELATWLGPAMRAVRVEVVSILAGTPIASLRASLGDAHTYVRVMPNLAASVGKGIAAICHGQGTPARPIEAATRLFEAVGSIVRVDEPLMDAFTAVAGSGPAYLFLLAEAMAVGAARVGFDPATAREIVRRTIAGSATLMERDTRSFAELRASVTSKGGTTAAAMGVLENAGFAEAVTGAIVTARDRGRELAEPPRGERTE